VGERPEAPASVGLRPARATRVIGVPIDGATCRRLLEPVGFQLAGGEDTAEDTMVVQVPSWRSDVVREVDLVEEVARLHGYDALPSEIRPFRPGRAPDHPLVPVIGRLQRALAGAGLFEARPLPFVAGQDDTHVRLLNPLAENEAHLRTSVIGSLARRAEHNLAHKVGDVRLFEVGTVFTRSAHARPTEQLRVAALVMGRRRPPHFTEPKPPHWDAWDAKALAELVAAVAFPGRAVALLPAGEGTVLWRIAVDGTAVGTVEEVPLDAPVWAAPAFAVELTLGDVERMAGEPATEGVGAPQYRPLPVTPAAEFDLALLVPVEMPAAAVETVLRRTAGELLEALELFDEFRGAGVPDGQRSLAWRLVFRHPERTLRDKEIEGRRARLVRALQEELNVHVRA